MHILFLSNTFPTPLQPARGTFNYELCRALAARHRVSVISPIPWHSARTLPDSSDHVYHDRSTPGMTIFHPRFYYPPRALRGFHAECLQWSIRDALKKIVHRASPDVVVGYWAYPDGEVAVRVALQLGVPSVVMSGGSDVLVSTREPRTKRRVMDTLARADGIVVVSEHLRGALASCGLGDRHVLVCRRGVNRGLFHPGAVRAARQRLQLDPDQKVFLWVGRMVQIKGLDVLISAVSMLRRRIKQFHLFLIGTGQLEHSVRLRLEQERLTSHVSLLGPRPPQELPDWYRAVDATVLASHSEGIPNVLLESIACGTPFIASDVGGISEIADHTRDMLVPVNDPLRLAQAMEKLPRKPEEACAPPQKLRSWAEAADDLAAWIATVPRRPVSQSA